MADTVTLERATKLRLVAGMKKDPETQTFKPVVHEVLIPGDMTIGDVLTEVGSERARPVMLMINFKHANPNSRTPIGKEYEICSYASGWQAEGPIDASSYEFSNPDQAKLEAFVKKYS
jgi:hypothetical protein